MPSNITEFKSPVPFLLAPSSPLFDVCRKLFPAVSHRILLVKEVVDRLVEVILANLFILFILRRHHDYERIGLFNVMNSSKASKFEFRVPVLG